MPNFSSVPARELKDQLDLFFPPPFFFLLSKMERCIPLPSFSGPQHFPLLSPFPPSGCLSQGCQVSMPIRFPWLQGGAAAFPQAASIYSKKRDRYCLQGQTNKYLSKKKDRSSVRPRAVGRRTLYKSKGSRLDRGQNPAASTKDISLLNLGREVPGTDSSPLFCLLWRLNRYHIVRIVLICR